jgi:hypothetical protein
VRTKTPGGPDFEIIISTESRRVKNGHKDGLKDATTALRRNRRNPQGQGARPDARATRGGRGGQRACSSGIRALIAELTRVDGKPIVYEDVLAMELEDVLLLQEQVLGTGDGNFQGAAARAAEPAACSLPQPQSPDSSRSDSGSES